MASGWEQNEKYVLEAIARLQTQIDVRAKELTEADQDRHNRIRHDLEAGFAMGSAEHQRLAMEVNAIKVTLASIQATAAAEREQTMRRGAAAAVAISSAITILLEVLRAWTGRR